MKVLMFGWEFPPHISGGLGTACEGLTRALEKEDVQVLFVVPKLNGGETAERTLFVNASAVPIVQQKQIPANRANVATSSNTPHNPKTHTVHTIGSETLIEVPSFLDPYTINAGGERKEGLSQWNYSFEEAAPDVETRTSPFPAITPVSEVVSSPEKIHEPYKFAGGYGENLMEEVARYADVAAEIARTHTFDVIHAHDWMTYRAGIAASKVSGKPLVVHVHATEIDRCGAHTQSVVYDIEKAGMKAAEKVVVVSNWTKQVAIKHYGIDESKIEVVHNGITPRNETPAAYLAPPVGSRIVTFFGRITYQKGPMYFVEAARKVHEKFPDVHFVVAGSGDLLPDMIERIAALRLSRNFHFTGFLKGTDIDRIWSMSSVYVMPSVSEPFGIAPLEAIQAGVPVIVSKQAGVSEVMPHAMKVDFWNSLELAEAICDVLRFKSLANTLRTNGVEELKNITWDKAAKKLTYIYHELINHPEQKSEKYPTILSGASACQT